MRCVVVVVRWSQLRVNDQLRDIVLNILYTSCTPISQTIRWMKYRKHVHNRDASIRVPKLENNGRECAQWSNEKQWIRRQNLILWEEVCNYMNRFIFKRQYDRFKVLIGAKINILKERIQFVKKNNLMKLRRKKRLYTCYGGQRFLWQATMTVTVTSFSVYNYIRVTSTALKVDIKIAVKIIFLYLWFFFFYWNFNINY